MKASLVFVAVLFLAVSTFAQHSRQTVSGPSLGNSGGGSGGGSMGASAAGRPVNYEPPRNFEVGYAANDGRWVPSTYMSYEEALAFGKQVAAELELSRTTPLGDAARARRAEKVLASRPSSGTVQDGGSNPRIVQP